ncbi:hypothetical protein HMPREF3156_01849 [Neisseria sp. HMSC06F02]|nr:hypothetical protein HMPREF3156_01849 [Neisseria sp. HMSC06F02]
MVSALLQRFELFLPAIRLTKSKAGLYRIEAVSTQTHLIFNFKNKKVV